MNEYILSFTGFDKAIALLVIEPLYSTFRHFKSFPAIITQTMLLGALLQSYFGTARPGERPISYITRNTEPLFMKRGKNKPKIQKSKRKTGISFNFAFACREEYSILFMCKVEERRGFVASFQGSASLGFFALQGFIVPFTVSVK